MAQTNPPPPPDATPPPNMTSFYGRHGCAVPPGSRDLRYDFMRGFAMLSIVAAHMEMFSWFNFLFWERLGLVSAAGMFVATAGLVPGLVNRRVMAREGMIGVTERLWRRSFVLWRALVVTVFLVILIRAVGVLDVTAVTTFTNRWAEQTYPMIPAPEVSWRDEIALVLTMRVSPHQVQILGLYVFLLAAAPLGLWLLSRRLLGVFFALSWGIYFTGWIRPVDTPH